MSLAINNFIHCDELENIPRKNRDNYLYELILLQKELSQNATILQVGSMDGMRIVRLLEIRPDIKVTGIELEKGLVELAKQNLKKCKLDANFIIGDITSPPAHLSHYDYVICLNNTLGYIPNQNKAIEEMKKLGTKVIVSVYGEKFDNRLARKYFHSLNIEVDVIKNDQIILKDSTIIKRYNNNEIKLWNSKIQETPIGYFCVFNTK